MILTLITLLHVLMFVYWLGGDLGAFYSSYLLVDEKRSVDGRFAAVNILNNVDMAPRTSILLALPTGLTLAQAKSWMSLPPGFIALVWLAASAWIALVWYLHLKHNGPPAALRRLDLILRWSTVAALVGAGAAGLVGALPMPLFIALKLILLGAAFFMGLMVRAALPPLGPALAQMKTGGPTAESDRALRITLVNRTKPMILAIWAILVVAAFLGIATPV